MLSTVWSSQGEWFATDASSVVEVVPLVDTRAIPGTPGWFVGLADHHGRLVPIIDADRMLGRESSPATLASRVLMLRVPCCGTPRTVGLRVESVRGLERVDHRDTNGHAGLRNPEMPHLGAVVPHRGETVQRVDAAAWLDGDRGDLLFGGGALAEIGDEPAAISEKGERS